MSHEIFSSRNVSEKKFIILVSLNICRSSNISQWSISIQLFILCIFVGPEKWPELFPMASGHRQSPVNINRESTTRGSTLKHPLTWRYVPSNTKSLVNPGYCWRVDVNGEGSSLSGGPLFTDVFQLEQFHCHWGCSDGKGNICCVNAVSYYCYYTIIDILISRFWTHCWCRFIFWWITFGTLEPNQISNIQWSC